MNKRMRGGGVDMTKSPGRKADPRPKGTTYKGGGLLTDGQVRKNGPEQKFSPGGVGKAGLKDGTLGATGNQSQGKSVNAGGTNKGGAGRAGTVWTGGNAR